jgi:hypothetical protein
MSRERLQYYCTKLYLLRLSRYVHLNPVFTPAARRRPVRERVTMLRQYRWSSYRSYIGSDPPLGFVDHAPILATVSPGRTRRAQAYRRFVEAGIETLDAAFLEAKSASPLCIGSEAFRDKIRMLYRRLLEARPQQEDVAFRRTGTVLSIDEILAVACRRLAVDREGLLRRQRNSLDRAIASRMLCDHGGLTQRQVAQVLGIRNGAPISQQLRKLARELDSNRTLDKQVAGIADELRRRRDQR